MATDFQNFADGIEAATSIMSVQVLEDGTCGDIRVVAGNKGYIDSIEHPAADYSMKTNKFVPNSLYTDYVPRDLNFEDYCFRSAVGKKCLHSYVKPNQMPIWFNMTFMPLGPSEGNIHYCSYTMEVNFEANTKRMSNVSYDLAADVLETCIKLRGATDFKKAMQEVIVDIRELCKAEHCSILLLDTYEKKYSTLCESVSENTKLTPREESPENFYNIALTWEDLIGSSNCIIAKDDHDMELVKERNPEWYESLKYAHADNIVMFPLKSRDQLLGYIWAINFDAAQAPRIKDTLELTTFILGSEIGNHLLLDRLKVLSSKDMLTGVLNRNEMNNLVDKLSNDEDTKKTVGVIFADLNGLKTVNDEYGHAAGDTLLKDAAKALEEVFPRDCIYRAGGDEFTVIILGLSEDELNNKINELREASNQYERVSFAIGGCVEDDFHNTRLALKIADQRMYADKKLFYENHPEFKKRL
ncbi:MAG: sensor domain-containing diguanylate cyclase [Lachnospiraceae bacterium]|nr:sensor domain-containing diguanylate cyclase [Lachnospiraceae bacterium]